MKLKLLNICFIFSLLSLSSCQETKNSLDKEAVTTKKESTAAIKTINPCDLFDTQNLVDVFGIADASTIEMYAREQNGSKKQCQFLWPEEKGSVAGSQIMIDITSKAEDMGATFSRMLQLDLQNGLSANENGQTTIIKPTGLIGFGKSAYHWEQPNFQNVQKITFQVENNYRIDITYNAHNAVNISKDLIKMKLIEIGKQIKQKL